MARLRGAGGLGGSRGSGAFAWHDVRPGRTQRHMTPMSKTAPASQCDTVPFDARVGQLLRGKWRLDRLLGIGGTSRVYAATHRNGRRGAVKLLNPDLRYLLEVRERFFRECLVASRIRHPSVVGVLDDDVTEDGTPFLVMELLQGESVGSVLRREGRLRPERVIEIGVLLLEALEVVHEAGVVHADVKPENLFWTVDGTLKLLDFGIALASFDGDVRGAHRREGVTMGTPGYMPPEQARGEWSRVGPSSDLWAAGATLFRLLTGSHIHAADTPGGLLRLTLLMPALPVMARLPEAPTPLASVIDRALSMDREHRFESARAMRAALEAAADVMREHAARKVEHTLETTLRSQPTPMPGRRLVGPPPSRRALASIGRAGLSYAAPLFVGIALGATAASQSSGQVPPTSMDDKLIARATMAPATDVADASQDGTDAATAPDPSACVPAVADQLGLVEEAMSTVQVEMTSAQVGADPAQSASTSLCQSTRP